MWMMLLRTNTKTAERTMGSQSTASDTMEDLRELAMWGTSISVASHRTSRTSRFTDHHHRAHPSALCHVHHLSLRRACQDREPVGIGRVAHDVIEYLRLERPLGGERRDLEHGDLRQALDHPELGVGQGGLERPLPLAGAHRVPDQHPVAPV